MQVELKEKTSYRDLNIPFEPKLEYIDKNLLISLLQRVEKPGRYTGGGIWNTQKKSRKFSRKSCFKLSRHLRIRDVERRN